MLALALSNQFYNTFHKTKCHQSLENWQAPFSDISVTIQLTELQVHLSDHIMTIPSPLGKIHFSFYRMKLIYFFFLKYISVIIIKLIAS